MNRQENLEKVYRMDGKFFYLNREYWEKHKEKKTLYANVRDDNIGGG